MIIYPLAKINLTLAVTGKRADGYHDLDTVFQPVSLCDKMELVRSGDFRFRCSLPELETPDNLVCRAYRLMKETFGFRDGLSVYLEKHIPSQAGLGGGSGDAAAMLLGCNALFGLGQTPESLCALGAHLGADVPALLFRHAARGRGTGAELTPVRTKSCWPLLIVKPEIGLSTPAMYRRIDEAGCFGGTARSERMVQALETDDIRAAAACLYNDFEAVAGEAAVTEAGAALKAAGALGTLLSGSGSAVFGLFADAASRDAAQKLLGGQYRVFACETVNEVDP